LHLSRESRSVEFRGELTNCEPWLRNAASGSPVRRKEKAAVCSGRSPEMLAGRGELLILAYSGRLFPQEAAIWISFGRRDAGTRRAGETCIYKSDGSNH